MSVHVLPFASAHSHAPARNHAAARSLAPAASAESAPLRLTRRGRLILVGAPLMLAAAALLAFLGFFTAPAMASGGSPEQTRTIQVGVSAGDSLWSLATEFAPDRDPRTVVADIVELNNLDNATVPAGRQLYIPVSR
ncbi:MULTISPECIES: LysM peptidoglycan-binding domain-containing protein [unclassified Arthrobacter]|uniref:LysM peptidoglycan-binding domain-containing protein n=1 Tax=unclassified Arthrobacter TaxID=235627 RepID=UPI001E360D6F|nr:MULTISPECIES: LysM peptidoglycan-binding domain-containing protein [unclassified Arthrobacter]MCC9146306.1 LysM peptidoglycan-binding domain-containing protein [Arthrobacter sp. zg-Y919]MDK1277536.1 LysM peptidoglycan-binding domain-containing protein [Arthrobacter sp. zg.Y919]MDM7990322.1 LysM peptidoglycan-binding domain-containing protein [Arthrobacter sp. zg-Y877]WIB04019.1 LysM peptidoglycan-binding domain-containing protein [Arthrobacter sp. zg-Y919]